ncbi:MAG: hypothetical protein MRZ79_08555 [Bacteroidia bacterium]|nr:hypothetical protein [Bacteroidia bacterium]
MSSATYSFENNKNSYRDETKAQEELKVFMGRLGLPNDVPEDLKEELLNYVTDVHLRIGWYNKKLSREKTLRNLYITITVALLGILPLLIFGMSSTEVTDNWVAFLTAGLSGLIGVHKGFSSWLEQRRVISSFWKAMADLKEALYELEDNFKKGKAGAWGAKEIEDLLKSLKLGSKFAQRVERKERDEFFKNYKTPKFDLLSSLSSTGKKAEDVTELYLNPNARAEITSQNAAARMAEELMEAQTEVIQFEFEVTELHKKVEEKSKELENAPEDEVTAIKAGLKELQVKLERAEVNLISAKGRVKALLYALDIEEPSDSPSG